MSKGVSKRKIDVLSLQFSQKENLKKCSNLKSRKIQVIFGETFILALRSSAVFCLQILISDFF